MVTGVPNRSPSRTRHRFTVEEYEALWTQGILGHSIRFELLHGEIVEMSPIGRRHLYIVNNLNRELVLAVNHAVGEISTQNPIILAPHDAPEPDFAVLRVSPDLHQHSPIASDVWLVIEVSDSTLSEDLNDKLPMYAGAGIEEAWIVDVNNEVVTRYTQPIGDRYLSSTSFKRGDVIGSTVLEVRIDVEKIFH